MKKEDITKTELKKAAKELNEQLGLEPPILLDIKVNALEKKVIEAAALIDPEQDEFSDEVWEILEALDAAHRPNNGEDGAETESDETVIEGDEADALVEEALDDTLVEDFKGAKKLAELKELAQEWECFANLDLDSYKGLAGPRQLRADMLECLPDDVREQVEPKPAEKSVPVKKVSATATQKVAKNEWAAGETLRPANAGTKVAKALDYIAEQKMKNIPLSEFAEACDWRPDLAKSYLTQNIVQLGYGVKLHDDGSFDLNLPAGTKTIQAHNKK